MADDKEGEARNLHRLMYGAKTPRLFATEPPTAPDPEAEKVTRGLYPSLYKGAAADQRTDKVAESLDTTLSGLTDAEHAEVMRKLAERWK